MGCVVYLYLGGLWHGSGRANSEESDRTGWVESQQVVVGGRYISASAGGITVVYWVAVCFA